MKHLKLGCTLEETKPYNWSNYSLTVVMDGYTVDGIRVHVVKQDFDNMKILANAIVISEKNLWKYLGEGL